MQKDLIYSANVSQKNSWSRLHPDFHALKSFLTQISVDKLWLITYAFCGLETLSALIQANGWRKEGSAAAGPL